MLTEVCVGLGSNLGDRHENILVGLRLMSGISDSISVSGIYETSPHGFGIQPYFLNAACIFWTRLDPFELLNRVREIQSAVGVRTSVVNGPRALDIDILLSGSLVLDTPNLKIPHPRMHERRFVLAPLAEIAPSLIHPTLKLSVRDMLSRISGSEDSKETIIIGDSLNKISSQVR